MDTRWVIATVLTTTLVACSDDDAKLQAPLALLTQQLTEGVIFEAYEAPLEAAGGVVPYTWSIAAGELPVGLKLDGARITGRPTRVGTSTLTVRVIDAAQASATHELPIRIAAVELEPLENECRSGIQVALVDGTATYMARLPDEPTDDRAAACGTDDGDAWVYFNLELDDQSHVEIRVAGDVLAALGDQCPLDEQGTQVCGNALDLTLHPGTYRVGVFGDPSTLFELTITARPRQIDPNAEGTCTNPIEVTLARGQNDLMGDFDDLDANEVRRVCDGIDRRDIVYQLTVNERSALLLDAQDDLHFAFIDGDCESNARSCGDNSEQLFIDDVAPGTYTLILEERNNHHAYHMRITRFDYVPRPANDRCEGAEVLDLSSGPARVSGRWLGAAPESGAGCGGQRARFYSVTLDEPASLDITDANDDSAIQILEGCGGAELACNNRDVCPASLDAGTYVIRVSHAYNDRFFGSFDLTVARGEAVPRPTNDTCATAEVVTPSEGVASVSGAMLYAEPDPVAPQCGSSSRGDVYYALTLAERSDVSLRTADNSGLSASLFSGSCTNPTGGVCLDRLGSTQTWFSVPAGPLYIALERGGSSSELECNGSRGSFELDIDVQPSPPAPPNDTCASPTVITFTGGHGSIAAAHGTTVGAANDLDPLTCPADSEQPTGLDVFYEIVVPVASKLRVTPTNVSEDMSVSLHSLSCGDTGALACGSSSGGDGFETTFGVPAGSYFLRVEQVGRFGDTVTPADFTYAIELLAP
ncbi:MAG: putative Ig domain-containing protein [Deltaproteobacteria bacterium]